MNKNYETTIEENEKFILNVDDELNIEIILKFIERHKNIVRDRYTVLEDYYKNKHAILNRTMMDSNKPNNRTAINLCAYVSDTLSGIFMGKKVSYNSNNVQYLEQLRRILKENDEESENSVLASKSSIKGTAFELVYTNEDGDLCFDALDTDSTFLILDNKIRPQTVAGIRYYDVKNSNDKVLYTIIECYQVDKITTYRGKGKNFAITKEEGHSFNRVPILEFANNRHRKSDFEDVIGLNDAYEKIVADANNDIEAFAGSYLYLKGAGGTTQEDFEVVEENRVILGDKEGDAKFLTKQIDYNTLKYQSDLLLQNLHKTSYTPDMSQALPANLSGSAIKTKYFNTIQHLGRKQNMFKKALTERLKFITIFLNANGFNFNTDEIEIKFNLNLPVNFAEVADAGLKYNGVLPYQMVLEELNTQGLEIDINRAMKLKEEEKKNEDIYSSIPTEGALNE